MDEGFERPLVVDAVLVEGAAEVDRPLDDGTRVTRSLVERLTGEEFARVRDEVGPKRFDGGRFDEARALFVRVATSAELEEFLTLSAYEVLVANETHADPA